MLKDKIEALKAQIADLKAENEEALEALRIKYLSKKGEVTALFNEFRDVAPEQKRELGQKLNELKNLATEKINALREATKQQAKNVQEQETQTSPSPTVSSCVVTTICAATFGTMYYFLFHTGLFFLSQIKHFSPF